MSDIYDTNKELSNMKNLISHYKEICHNALKSSAALGDVDANKVRVSLALNWPGDERVQQIVWDIMGILDSHKLDSSDVLSNQDNWR